MTPLYQGLSFAMPLSASMWLAMFGFGRYAICAACMSIAVLCFNLLVESLSEGRA